MVSWKEVSRIPLFASLSRADLGALLPVITPRKFRTGDSIFHKDDPGHALYFLRSGKVKVHVDLMGGGDLILAVLEAGDCFGELSLLDGRVRSADVTALEPTETLAIYRQEFLACLGRHPQVALSLMQMLAERLRHADEHLETLAHSDTYTRVLRLLMHHVETAAPQKGARTPATITVTQKELAAQVGAARESVNKALASCRRRGLLDVERRRITILRPDLLAAELSRRWL